MASDRIVFETLAIGAPMGDQVEQRWLYGYIDRTKNAAHKSAQPDQLSGLSHNPGINCHESFSHNRCSKSLTSELAIVLTHAFTQIRIADQSAEEFGVVAGIETVGGITHTPILEEITNTAYRTGHNRQTERHRLKYRIGHAFGQGCEQVDISLPKCLGFGGTGHMTEEMHIAQLPIAHIPLCSHPRRAIPGYRQADRRVALLKHCKGLDGFRQPLAGIESPQIQDSAFVAGRARLHHRRTWSSITRKHCIINDRGLDEGRRTHTHFSQRAAKFRGQDNIGICLSIDQPEQTRMLLTLMRCNMGKPATVKDQHTPTVRPGHKQQQPVAEQRMRIHGWIDMHEIKVLLAEQSVEAPVVAEQATQLLPPPGLTRDGTKLKVDFLRIEVGPQGLVIVGNATGHGKTRYGDKYSHDAVRGSCRGVARYTDRIMCGIAGILYRDRKTPVDKDLLRAMTDVIRHRGPDGEGMHIAPGLGLGHRRLAIIDPAAGQQPMLDPDTQNVIIYNGEVYNYVEIRKELLAAGYHFRTDSDTEVILKAYAHWGEECLGRFNGMWAFALWDCARQRLFIARDRLGIKPLHYAITDERIVFSSEIKSLFAAGVPRTPDTTLLDVYLTFGYIPAPHSFFSGIRKLPPGHYILTDGTHTEIRRYWDLPVVPENEMRRDSRTVCEEFEHLLEDAVRISMRSDVPFGAFLSGGLDSSSIVMLMAEQTTLPVETFTIGFDDPDFDERGLARLVSARARTRHHEAVVSPDDLEMALDQIAFHYDEPFGDSSALPTSHVSRLAARHVKMVLTGDGGDEVLSGYPAYQVEKLAGSYKRIPQPVRALAEGALAGVANLSRGRLRYAANRYHRLLATTAAPFETRLLTKAAWLEQDRRQALLDGIRVHRAEDVLADLMRDCPYQDSFYRLMYFNYKVSLPDDMLTKVDRMTMASSLEARVPFLDYRLVELMSGVHKSVKLDGLTRKAVLRKTVGRKLPEAVLAGSKRGFVTPLRSWFRQGDFAETLIRKSVAVTGFSRPVVDSILAEQRTGQRDYGNLLWMLMVLGTVLESKPHRA